MKFFHRYHIAGQSLRNTIQSAIYLTTLLLFLMLPLFQNFFLIIIFLNIYFFIS